MFDLPRRETELVVEVEDGAVKLYLEPLSDRQYFEVNEAARVEKEADGETRVTLRVSRVPGLFEAQLRRVEGVGVEDGTFDVANPEHRGRIPQSWKGVAVTRLINYAMGVDRAMGNASRPRDGSSPAAGMPSED